MVDVDISIRSTEGENDTQPMLLWDLQWNADAGVLDWVLAGTTDRTNLLGLQALRALDTAILIQLATNKRAPPYVTLPSGSDRKGWWGDTVDIGADETDIGSWFWLLYRSPLTDATIQLAQSYAYDCLQPLIAQGAVARFDVVTTADKVKGFLMVDISGYSQSGQLVYSQKFNRLWQQEFSSQGRTGVMGLEAIPNTLPMLARLTDDLGGILYTDDGGQIVID